MSIGIRSRSPSAQPRRSTSVQSSDGSGSGSFVANSAAVVDDFANLGVDRLDIVFA
jgi:hypothetical protein